MRIARNSKSLLLSVVTAVFNRVETLGYAFHCVDGQKYPLLEHIVIDGGSTDGSRDLIRSRARQDRRSISEPDDGIYDALNKGVALASGEVICLLHSDDMFARDDVVGKVARCFEDSNVHAVYGDLQYVRRDDSDRVVRH